MQSDPISCHGRERVVFETFIDENKHKQNPSSRDPLQYIPLTYPFLRQFGTKVTMCINYSIWWDKRLRRICCIIKLSIPVFSGQNFKVPSTLLLNTKNTRRIGVVFQLICNRDGNFVDCVFKLVVGKFDDLRLKRCCHLITCNN